MKYAFIKAHRIEYPVELMCRVLGASKSGFYGWLGRDHDARTRRRQSVLRTIEDLHRGSRRTYGSPRVFRALKALGEKISKRTVETLMREASIRARTQRRFKATTNSKHSLPIAENRARRGFEPGRPGRLWVSDITYLATDEGWLYLAVVIDCGTRKVVGWAMDERMTAALVETALEMAVRRQRPDHGLVHHSDRGCQYASASFRALLDRHGIVASMSRKGNCYDNAVAESFFHTLKVEHVYHEKFATRAVAKASVFEWIEVFYNRQRLHSTLGYLPPECYERQVAGNCA